MNIKNWVNYLFPKQLEQLPADMPQTYSQFLSRTAYDNDLTQSYARIIDNPQSKDPEVYEARLNLIHYIKNLLANEKCPSVRKKLENLLNATRPEELNESNFIFEKQK